MTTSDLDLPTGAGGAVRIEIRYEDGLVSTFNRTPDGGWSHMIAGLNVIGYDPSNVMRVLGAALGTTDVFGDKPGT